MFIKKPVDQIGVSGGVASFVCQATGDPKPRVTWNKKGKKVNSQRFEVRDVPEKSGVSMKRERLTQSSPCSSAATLRADNKGKFGRGRSFNSRRSEMQALGHVNSWACSKARENLARLCY